MSTSTSTPAVIPTYTIASIDATNSGLSGGANIMYTADPKISGQFNGSNEYVLLSYKGLTDNYQYVVVCTTSDLTSLSSNHNTWIGFGALCLNPTGNNNQAGIIYNPYNGLTAGTNVADTANIASANANASTDTSKSTLVCTAGTETVAFSWTK